MTSTKPRKGTRARELPAVGTTLSARYKGKSYTGTIVEAKDARAGRALRSGKQLFESLSAAGKAITGHSVNGWRFWHPLENDAS